MIKSINEPGSSREVMLTPNSLNEPVALPEGPPKLEGLQPAEAVEGTASQLVVVHGVNFVEACIINFNGADQLTEYVAPNKIKATVALAEMPVGEYPVVVLLGAFETTPLDFAIVAKTPLREVEGELADPDELEDEIEAAEEEGDFKPLHRGKPTKTLPTRRKK